MTAGRRDGSGDHDSGDRGSGDRRISTSAFGLSRRRLLAGLGGIGAIGAASGAGTSAYFTDAASFAGNEMGAGEVDIDVSCGRGTNCAVEDGRVTFAFDRIYRGDGGEETFTVDVQTNPARLWLGTDCPPAFDPLGDAIEASLDVRIGSSWITLSSGTLAGIRRDLVAGVRLDDLDGDACLDPEGEPLEIVLDWSLPSEAPVRAARKSTSFGFQLYTEQCRHVSETVAEGSNPFADTPACPDPCVICDDENGVKIGSLTFKYLGSESAEIVATATGGGAGGVGNGGTEVFRDDVDPNETFTVDAGPTDVAGDDGNWIGPNLYVDDGSGQSSSGNSDKPAGVKIHTSCSERLEPGMDFKKKFELVSGTTVDGEPLCDNADDPEEPDEPEESDEPDDCVICDDEDTSLQTLTFRYEGIDSAHLKIVSTKGNTSGVLFEGDVQTDDEFTIDGKDIERPGKGKDRLGPEIRIDRDDGEEQTDVHVSCSKLLAVGMAFGDDGKYVIVNGITTDGQRICAEEDR